MVLWTAPLLIAACTPEPAGSALAPPAPQTVTLTSDAPDDPPVDPPAAPDPVAPGVVETLRTLGLDLTPIPTTWRHRLSDGAVGGNGHQLILPVGPPDHTRLLALGFRAPGVCGQRPGLYDLAHNRLGCFPDDLHADGVNVAATRNFDDGATVIGLRDVITDPPTLHLYRLGADDAFERLGTFAPPGAPHLRGLWFDPPPSLNGWALFAAERDATTAALHRLMLAPDGRGASIDPTPALTLPCDDVPAQLAGVPADGAQTAFLLAYPPQTASPAERVEVIHIEPSGAASPIAPFQPGSAIFQSSPGEPAVPPFSLAPFRPMGFHTFCSTASTSPLAFAFGPWSLPTENLTPGCYLAISSAGDPMPIFRWPDFPTPLSDAALVDASNFAGIDGKLRSPRSTHPGFYDAYLRAWGGVVIAVVTQPADQPRHTVILGIAGGDDGGTARFGLTELSEHGVAFFFQAGVSGPHPLRVHSDFTSPPPPLLPYETSRPDDHVDAGRFYPAYALFETDDFGPDLRLPNPRTLTPVMADGRLLIGVAHANVARPSDARAYDWTSTGRCALWIVQPTTPGAAYDLVHLRDRHGDPLDVPMAFTAHLSVGLSVDPTTTGSYLALCDGVTLDDARPAVQIAP